MFHTRRPLWRALRLNHPRSVDHTSRWRRRETAPGLAQRVASSPSVMEKSPASGTAAATVIADVAYSPVSTTSSSSLPRTSSKPAAASLMDSRNYLPQPPTKWVHTGTAAQQPICTVLYCTVLCTTDWTGLSWTLGTCHWLWTRW